MKALGTTDDDFPAGLVKQLVDAGSEGQSAAEEVFSARRARRLARLLRALTLMHAARVRVAIDPTLAAALPLAA
jgi:hypothetical protein